jgi:hypothetical protein
MTSTDFTAAHDLAERLNDEAMRLQGRGIDRGCVDSSLAGSLAIEAAELIERQADRINHLTNINDGLRETIDELRAGLAELKSMCAPEQSE